MSEKNIVILAHHTLFVPGQGEARESGGDEGGVTNLQESMEICSSVDFTVEVRALFFREFPVTHGLATSW
jgi:hypothetical protein